VGIADTLTVLGGKIRAKSVEVSVDIPDDLPRVHAVGVELNQVWMNLLDNALDAVGVGGEVAVSAAPELKCVTVRVMDNGPGIPPEILGRIFDPFFTTRDVGDGIGLGLSMAYGVVTGHGGKIRAANRNAGGASIMLEFPRKGPHVLAAGAAVRKTPEPAARQRGRRVLIADEVVVVQELLVDMLEEGEHHIDITVTGTDAMGRIVSDDYDLLILDMRLPDMTGPQIYDQVAELRPEMLRRLVFMTSGPVPPETESFLRRTGAPCLVKPFEVDRALRVMDTILQAD
jgi:CheY-like chemotaxis protein